VAAGTSLVLHGVTSLWRSAGAPIGSRSVGAMRSDRSSRPHDADRDAMWTRAGTHGGRRS
jgi:hypothetical protein